MKSWITSLTGSAVILFAIGGIALGKISYGEGAPLILAGLGLIAAKDFNVHGGSKPYK